MPWWYGKAGAPGDSDVGKGSAPPAMTKDCQICAVGMDKKAAPRFLMFAEVWRPAERWPLSRRRER